MRSVVHDLPGRIRALPGIERLLEALDGLPPAFLVGGTVRDLLRGASGVDLDVAVQGDAPAAAGQLAARLGGEAVDHERFGTATVVAAGLAIDLAATRRERYPRPGALPEVEPAPLSDDLERRDFTINAMAASLSPGDVGRLHDPHRGLADLEARVVRVLHPRSFLDDPTRLLRAVRYESRLGFRMDADSEALARQAAESGVLATVSGPRVRDELLDLLAEPESAAGVARLRDLRLDRAMHPALAADPELVASASLGAAETGADRVLAALAALVSVAPTALRPWLDELHLRRDRRDRVARAATAARELDAALADAGAPSAVHRLLADEPPEALALVLGLGASGDPVLRYLSDWRDMRLEVTGDDLVAAGVPESPALGRALRETLRRKLDGQVSGRADELRVALALARGHESEAEGTANGPTANESERT